MKNIIERLGEALSETASESAGGMSMQPMTRSEANEARRGLKVTILPPIPQPAKLYADFPRTLVVPELISHLATEPVTKEERKFLIQKNDLFEQYGELKMSFTPEAARQLYKAQARDIAASLKLGEVQSARQANVLRREDIDLEFSMKMSAAKAAQKQVSEEVRPVVLKIAQRLASAAQKIHDDLIVEEKAKFAKYGIPFAPSRIVVSFGQLVWLLPQTCAGSVGNSPLRQLLAIGVVLK